MTSAQSVSQPTVATSRRAMPAWQALARHVDELQGVTLRTLFDQDPGRARDLAFETCGMYVDLSKHRITRETVALLLELAQQCQVTQRRDAMFAGASSYGLCRGTDLRSDVGKRSAAVHVLEPQPIRIDVMAAVAVTRRHRDPFAAEPLGDGLPVDPVLGG